MVCGTDRRSRQADSDGARRDIVDAHARAQPVAQMGCQGRELRGEGREKKDIARAEGDRHRWAMRRERAARKRAVLLQPGSPTSL